MKQRYGKASVFVGLCALLLISMSGALLYAQKDQADADDYADLEKFLPGDDDAKVLLMIDCTTCHSAQSTKERLAERIGGDLTFWTTLSRRMNTTWNAKIPDEDIDAISAYLAKSFGPSSPAAKKKAEAEKNKKQ